MLLAHRIRLKPTPEQESQFVRACGVARFAYNWALQEWRRQHQAGERPTELKLRRKLNAIKRNEFPWMLEVTKSAPQQAIKNLGHAYRSFFEDLRQYRRDRLRWNQLRRPKFKKKWHRDSFRADNGSDSTKEHALKVVGKRVQVPMIGWVRMCEEVRFAGRIRSLTISRQGDAWFGCFTIDVPYEIDSRIDSTVVGVDLGITTLATLSDGSPSVESPKPLRRYLRKLRRLSRAKARKQAGSKNHAKARTKLARLHRRISDIRNDALHKLTTSLTRYRIIGIEDLYAKGLGRNRGVSRAVHDAGFGIFRRLLTYKTAMAGSTLVLAGRWFPSSKICSICGYKNESLGLDERIWTCVLCDTVHDREQNAARNLAQYAAGSAASACGAGSSGRGYLNRCETDGCEAGSKVCAVRRSSEQPSKSRTTR